MSKGGGWALLAAVLIISHPAYGATATPLAVIYDTESSSPPKILSQLISTLSSEAEATGRFLVTRPRLHLVDLLTSVDCMQDSPLCLTTLGKRLQVERMVLASVDQTPQGDTVRLRLFDVAAGAVIRRLDEPLTADNELRPLAARLFELSGDLRVQSSGVPVDVYINGTLAGQTPLYREGLTPGEHRIEARRDGAPIWSSFVTITADKVAEVILGVERDTEPTVLYKERVVLVDTPSTLSRISVWTWGSLLTGAAGLITGGVLGALQIRTQNEFNTAPVRTRDDVQRLQHLRDRGQLESLGANIAFGVGAAATAAGLIMLTIDLTSGSHEETSVSVGPTPGGAAFIWRKQF